MKGMNPVHTVVEVTAESTLVLSDNPHRRYVCIVNDSNETIYLTLNSEAVLHEGVRLNANGGSYEISQQIGNVYFGSIYAIHAEEGNKRLLVTEGAV